MNGADQVQRFQDAGFSPDEIAQWSSNQRSRLTSAGFSDAEVNGWFGQKEPDMGPVRDLVRGNLDTASSSEGDTDAYRQMAEFGAAHALQVSQEAVKPESPQQIQQRYRRVMEFGMPATTISGDRPARDFTEALQAGLQMSVSGLLARGKAPDIALAADPSTAQRVSASIGQVVGDLPFMAAGAVVGGAGGIETGPGAVATAAGGAFALPAGLRATLMDAYTKGGFKDFSDFWGRASGIIWEEAKGWMTGAATAGAGLAARTVLPAFAPATVQALAPTAAEIATMVTVGRALEGHAPSAQDFLDAAIVVGAFHGATRTPDYLAGKLRSTYAETGLKPRDVLDLADKDPTIVPDLVSDNRQVPASLAKGLAASIPRAGEEKLSPEGLAVQERFARALGGDLSGAAAAYAKLPESDGGRILNTDIARELSRDYRSSNDARSELSPAVHEPASWLVKRIFEQRLAEPVDPARDQVLFTAGGTGAGKTSALAGSDAAKSIAGRAAFVYDTNMNQEGSAAAKIDAVLASGRKATIAYVYRKPVEAFANGTLPRAERMGRTVPLDDHIATHQGMQDSMKALMGRYAGDDRVAFIGLDNSLGKGKQALVPIEGLVDRAYNANRQEYLDVANEAHAAGRISDRVFRGTLGRNPVEPQGVESPDGRGDGGKPAQGNGGRPPGDAGGGQPPQGVAPDPERAVLDRISVGDHEARAGSWSKFYTAMKDDLYPIRVLADALRADDTLTTSRDPYQLARLTRGLSGKAEQFLEYSPFKFDTYENVGKSLREVLAPVKDDLEGFRAYAVARRAVELERRGIATGVPIDEAKATVKVGEKYGKPFTDLLEYQEHLVRYLVDAGVVSKEGSAAMREANRDYVPFFRLMDEAQGAGGPGPGLSVRSPIKAIKGSGRKIVDPLESIVKNTYVYTALAERNAAGRALIDLWEKAGKPADLVEKITPPAKAIEIQDKEVQRFLEEHGIEGDPQAFTVFRRQWLNPAEDQIVVFRDGQRELYQVPKDVAAAFKATDRETAGALVKILAVPAKTLRAGSTLAPDFMLRNFARDQLDAAIFSDRGYIPVVDFLRGALSLAKHDDTFQAWLKSGGANATLLSMDRQYLQGKVNELADDENLRVRDRAWNLVKTPVEVLRIASELVENATRLGEFKRGFAATEGGKAGAQEAAFGSREVTLDFARIGAKTRSLNMITAFWNAQVEGVDRTVRAFKDNPLRTSARVAAYLTLPSVMLWWANHDDPRWKDIPDWERDTFWIVLTKDHIFRIPKPFELGLLFASLPERLLDRFAADKPEAFHDFSRSFMNTFGVNMVPTAAAPVVEQLTDHSFFTDRPLIPHSLEGLLPEYQYAPYTSEVTKALAHIIGQVNLKGASGGLLPNMREQSLASPLVIDNYVRGWTGTLGVYALQIADAALKKSGVLPDPVQPAWTLADYPGIKAFVVRHPSAQAQSIQNFEEHYTEAKRITDTIQYLAKQGDVNAAIRVAQIDPIEMVRLDGIHESINNASRLTQLIVKNPNFNADEKRQLIDNIYSQMIDMAGAGEQTLVAMKKTMTLAKAAADKPQPELQH